MDKEEILRYFQEEESFTFPKLSSIGGGDISTTYNLKSKEVSYFLKMNDGKLSDNIYEVEKKGLDLLSENRVPIPRFRKIFSFNGKSGLMMEFIPSVRPTSRHMKELGRVVAQMHLQTNHEFGLNIDNYIGSLPQSNTSNKNWISFYVESRLMPQFLMAVERKLLHLNEIPSSEIMESRLDGIMPEISPILLHGDLWSGNYLSSENGKVYLIDPAVYYGHSEVDIAMTHLFGGFSQVFYDVYHEVHPKLPEWKTREDIYQLYYLLVHLNLFGSSYYGSVSHIMSKYF